jgi:hypothetical protein
MIEIKLLPFAFQGLNKAIIHLIKTKTRSDATWKCHQILSTWGDKMS